MAKPRKIPKHLSARAFTFDAKRWNESAYLKALWGPWIDTVVTALLAAKKPGSAWQRLHAPTQDVYDHLCLDLNWWAQTAEAVILEVESGQAKKDHVLEVQRRGLALLESIKTEKPTP